jgi:hypothetical protein
MSLRTLAPTLAGYMLETINMSVPFLTGAIFLIFNGLLYKSFFLSHNKKQGNMMWAKFHKHITRAVMKEEIASRTDL